MQGAHVFSTSRRSRLSLPGNPQNLIINRGAFSPHQFFVCFAPEIQVCVHKRSDQTQWLRSPQDHAITNNNITIIVQSLTAFYFSIQGISTLRLFPPPPLALCLVKCWMVTILCSTTSQQRYSYLLPTTIVLLVYSGCCCCCGGQLSE